MPEGQFTGTRATYEYVADDGSLYLISLDETLGGLTGTGLDLANDTTTGTELPKRFVPRVVYWQGDLDGRIVRKALVCNTDGALYGAKSTALTIDGVDGSTTGRRGEKFTFRKLPPAS